MAEKIIYIIFALAFEKYEPPKGAATKTYKAKQLSIDKAKQPGIVDSRIYYTAAKKFFETISAKPKNKVKADPQVNFNFF